MKKKISTAEHAETAEFKQKKRNGMMEQSNNGMVESEIHWNIGMMELWG